MDASNPVDRAKLDQKQLAALIDDAFATEAARVPLNGTLADLDDDRFTTAAQATRIIDFAIQSQVAESQDPTALHQKSSSIIESYFSHGLMTDDLTRSALIDRINHGIWQRRLDLTETQMIDIVHVLQSTLENRESIEKIEARERAWWQSTFGWFGRIEEITSWIESGNASRISMRLPRMNETTRIRLLITELLLQIQNRRSNRLPESLGELNELLGELKLPNEVLRDLFTIDESNVSAEIEYFRYEVSGKGHKLYSVGENQIDDRGKKSNSLTYQSNPFDDISLVEHYSDH
ncbi:MAG: hypothetical protein AAF664_20985 [Planctomycetota bacterium]